MYNLLRFIKINNFIILFLIIEGFSIYLLVLNNSFQESKFIQKSTKYTSIVYEYFNATSNYIALKEKNKYLVNENAKLYSILYSDQEKNINNTHSFSYQSAKVLNNSINKRNNYITINKGKKHGIKEGMGIVTKNGIIGIIKSISDNYSVAISLLHRKSALGIKLKKSNHHGILKWYGYDYKTLNVTNFPNHIKINQGDTIITSSYSVVFPENIPVGKIKKFKKDNEGYFDVEVELFEDFNQLNFVFVIHSPNAIERINLEKNIIYE